MPDGKVIHHSGLSDFKESLPSLMDNFGIRIRVRVRASFFQLNRSGLEKTITVLSGFEFQDALM